MTKQIKLDRHQDYCECGAVKQKTAKTCMTCYNKRRAVQKKENKEHERKNIIKKYNLQKNERIDYSDEYLNELKRRDPNRICYIYKITNLVNGKLYIGLTTNTIKQRWCYHLKDLEKKKSSLYNAMNKYGIENFKMEAIEQCTLNNVRERERYWISFYNTYLDDTKGYNQSAGGELCILKTEDEKEIIELYNRYQNITLVANELHADRARVVRVLAKNDIEIKTAQEHQKEKAYSIFQYDKNNNLIQEFQSKYEAGQWLIENGFSNAKNNRNAGDTLRRYLMLDKNFVYGYYWYFDDKVPKESKDKYVKREKEQKRNNDKKYRKNEKYILYYKDKCPNCNNLKSKTSNLCKTCRIEEQQKENSIKPITREELKSLIRTNSFSEIGRIYNVSDNTIKKWCKSYNLPFRKLDINKISDKDWKNENWELKNIEKYQITHHKKIIPEYNQLKKDLYNMEKTELIEKYDYSCIKYFNKMVQKFGLLTDKEIIQKFTFEEWNKEKWKDKDFYNYVIKNRYSVKYPERDWFKREIRTRSFKDISSDFNVDKSTIKKILIYFNLPYYRDEVLLYTDEEWENEVWSYDTPATIEKGGQVHE